MGLCHTGLCFVLFWKLPGISSQGRCWRRVSRLWRPGTDTPQPYKAFSNKGSPHLQRPRLGFLRMRRVHVPESDSQAGTAAPLSLASTSTRPGRKPKSTQQPPVVPGQPLIFSLQTRLPLAVNVEGRWPTALKEHRDSVSSVGRAGSSGPVGAMERGGGQRLQAGRSRAGGRGQRRAAHRGCRNLAG